MGSSLIVSTAVKRREVLEALDRRMLAVAKDCDMLECDHAVGLCSGWHYVGYHDNKGNPAYITKTALYQYVRYLKEAMVETDKMNGGDLFALESYHEIKAIIKAIWAIDRSEDAR